MKLTRENQHHVDLLGPTVLEVMVMRSVEQVVLMVLVHNLYAFVDFKQQRGVSSRGERSRPLQRTLGKGEKGHGSARGAT